MEPIINYVIESSLILGVFYLFYYLVLRKETCFNLNRVYLLASLLLAVLIPFMSLPTTIVNTGIPGIMLPEVVLGSGSSANPGLPTWITVLIVIYLGGVVLASARFIGRLVVISRIISRSDKEYHGRVQIIRTTSAVPTFSFLNTIVINEDYAPSSDELDHIISHEKVHIRHGHTYDILLIELMKIIFWFNPVLSGYKNTLQQVHEYIADAAVTKDLNSGVYTKLLARQALVQLEYSLGNHFNKSQILNRIKMMKNNRKTSKVKLWMVPVVFLLTAVIACQESEPADAKDTLAEKKMKEAANRKEQPSDFDVAPEFPGGKDALFSYIINNLKYPEQARENGIEGKVMVEFTIDETGNVGAVKLLNGIGYGCDDAAMKVIGDMPKWEPAEKDGKVIKTKLVLPVTFKLPEKSSMNELPPVPEFPEENDS